MLYIILATLSPSTSLLLLAPTPTLYLAYTQMDPTAKEVSVEFPNLLRVYKDGSVERLFGSPNVPPSAEDPETGVASKDITISDETGLSARLYLPKLVDPSTQKLPILVYFHGGGFCLESAFSFLDHRYMNLLAAQAQVLVVSVEYRLAPEHPLPTAYDDCWAALNWITDRDHDPWLAAHGDLGAVYIGGDSAGGNIAHNIAMRAGSEKLANGVKLLGAFLSHPYFLDGPGPGLELAYKMWEFVYPNAPGGSNCYMINAIGGVGAPSLAELGCERVLVVVAEKDELRDTGVRYYEAMRESGFGGQLELFEMQGEEHCFHIFNTDTDNAKLLIQRLASFLRN